MYTTRVSHPLLHNPMPQFARDRLRNALLRLEQVLAPKDPDTAHRAANLVHHLADLLNADRLKKEDVQRLEDKMDDEVPH